MTETDMQGIRIDAAELVFRIPEVTRTLAVQMDVLPIERGGEIVMTRVSREEFERHFPNFLSRP